MKKTKLIRGAIMAVFVLLALLLGVIVGFGSTLIGLLFAYVDCYVRVRSRVMKKLFDVVSMLPVVSPPFVLSL